MHDSTAITVNGAAVSLGDVLRIAKWREQLQMIGNAIDAHLIRQTATEQGIIASDDELQQAANDFRSAHELYDAEKTNKWLTANHLTQANWEWLLENDIITRKLRDELIAGKVEQHFAENRFSFERATISHLVVKDEHVARELRAQIFEDEVDFHHLARQHSTDAATRLASGFVGTVRRTDLSAQEEAAIFVAREGDVVGPVKTDDGWKLIKIESFERATLSDAVREEIKAALFDEWLAERRRKARITVPLLGTEE